jgi:hypothetical protein
MMAQRRTLRRSLKLAEKEVENLRSMPSPETSAETDDQQSAENA